ncbi:protease inhibitor I42 family protein [Streptomyces sp. CA-250714]|uniref:protease inhibitor I42 family protein n=1 Tax=Streptomyces sp. CA-250714 TaxID=3240060 RepID=UPI003D8DDF4E
MKQATLTLAVLLAATACGGGGDNSDNGDSGGSGNDGADGGAGMPRPREFGIHDTRVQVRPHEQFVLKVPYRPSEGYRWIVRGDKPDPRTATLIDTRAQGFDPDRMGDRGERWYSYRAEKPGRTKLALRECFQCGTSNERVDADHPVKDVTFHITVAN